MIAIIGAGISGLSLGHYLLKNGKKDFIIYEKEKGTGGKMKTSSWNSINLEHGPNTLMSTPLLVDFIKDLNLDKEIVYPDEAIVKQRYIKQNGKITQLPSAPPQLLFSKILGLKSKASAVGDLFFKPKPVKEKETVAEFFRNHFTDEVVKQLVTPFCRGIYATAPEQLILRTTFPKLAEIQEKYGSVIKGLQKTKSVEKRKVFTLNGGMKQLTATLTKELKNHIISEEVTELKVQNGEYLVQTALASKIFSKVVLSLPAYEAQSLIKPHLPKLAVSLSKINYAKLHVQHRIYTSRTQPFPYTGFGVLYPEKESSIILGHIWNSNMAENNEGKTFITTMFKSDEVEKTTELLDNIFKQDYLLTKDEVEHTHTVKWKHAIPVYDVEHLEFLKEYKAGEEINLYFCSNLVNGVSIPDRIKESLALAEKI